MIAGSLLIKAVEPKRHAFINACNTLALEMLTSIQNPRLKQESNSGLVSFPSRYDDGERSTTCPTCGGTGRLTQEHENDLVALIPVRDNRLKPRRMVYIFIAALVIVLISGSITAVFLFPRDVMMEVIATKAVNVSISKDNHTAPFIIINTTMQINNSNFFDVKVKAISQQVTWDQHYVVADVIYSGVTLTVPSKSKILHSFLVKTKYEGDEAKKVRNVCCWSDILLVVDSQAQASGVTVSQELTNNAYKFLFLAFIVWYVRVSFVEQEQYVPYVDQYHHRRMNHSNL